MSLLADGAKRHGCSYEAVHDLFFRFHFIQRDGVRLKLEELTQEERLLYIIDNMRELLEFLIAAQTGCQLKGSNSIGRPGMQDAILAERILPDERQHIVRLSIISLCMQSDCI